MALIQTYQKIVTLSGSASGVVGVVVYTAPGRGRLLSLVLREETGGSATVLNDLWLCHNVASLGLSALPPFTQVSCHIGTAPDGTDIALTASGTADSLRTTFDRPITFAGGLVILANVTTSGSYTLEIALDLADLMVVGETA